MKRAFFFAALFLSACCHAETDDDVDEFICDGRPGIPLPTKDTDYCASGDHDGELCCQWQADIFLTIGQCDGPVCVASE